MKSIYCVKINLLFIFRYSRLIALLKKENAGHVPKKSKTFERQEIQKFLSEAPDEKYLLMKVRIVYYFFIFFKHLIIFFQVYVILSVSGGCRLDEMNKMQTSHIDDRGTVLVVQVPDTKTNKKRQFVVVDEMCGVNAIQIVRKYRALRPLHTAHNKFFTNFRSNKCTVQPVGVNTMAKIAFNIAAFLKLPNPESYTGHCFRRTSASLLANSGADILELKRHGGWKSSTVVEGYIDDSIQNKIRTSKKISIENVDNTIEASNRTSSTAFSEVVDFETLDKNTNIDFTTNNICENKNIEKLDDSPFLFSENCLQNITNSTININVYKS